MQLQKCSQNVPPCSPLFSSIKSYWIRSLSRFAHTLLCKVKIKSSTKCVSWEHVRWKAEAPLLSWDVRWQLCGVLHIYVHLMLFHIASYDFTAVKNVQSLKQRVKLYSTGVFWSVFLICVFDLSILFDALSSSFPPHFNKDKTESRIVAAKSHSRRNIKSFMLVWSER